MRAARGTLWTTCPSLNTINNEHVVSECSVRSASVRYTPTYSTPTQSFLRTVSELDEKKFQLLQENFPDCQLSPVWEHGFLVHGGQNVKGSPLSQLDAPFSHANRFRKDVIKDKIPNKLVEQAWMVGWADASPHVEFLQPWCECQRCAGNGIHSRIPLPTIFGIEYYPSMPPR